MEVEVKKKKKVLISYLLLEAILSTLNKASILPLQLVALRFLSISYQFYCRQTNAFNKIKLSNLKFSPFVLLNKLFLKA